MHAAAILSQPASSFQAVSVTIRTGHGPSLFKRVSFRAVPFIPGRKSLEPGD